MDDRRASLGCGTFILIALIVLWLGNTKSGEVLRELQNLQRTVEQVEQQNRAMGTELQELKTLLEQVRADLRAR